MLPYTLIPSWCPRELMGVVGYPTIWWPKSVRFYCDGGWDNICLSKWIIEEKKHTRNASPHQQRKTAFFLQRTLCLSKEKYTSFKYAHSAVASPNMLWDPSNSWEILHEFQWYKCFFESSFYVWLPSQINRILQWDYSGSKPFVGSSSHNTLCANTTIIPQYCSHSVEKVGTHSTLVHNKCAVFLGRM